MLLFGGTTSAQGWLNGGFEKPSDVSDRFPWGWADSPSEGAGYEARRTCNNLQAAVAAVGSCALRVRYVGSNPLAPAKDTAILARRVSALGIAGRTATLKARVRNENGSRGRLGVWLWSGRFEMAWDSSAKSSAWHSLEAHFQIPNGAETVALGVSYIGTSIAWFDDLQLVVDGQPYDDIVAARAPTDREILSLRSYTSQLDLQAADFSTEPLRPLDELARRSRIIGLGESSHGSREVSEAKSAVVRHLVEHDSVTVLALEANMPNARSMNEYVISGRGDPQKLVADLGFWCWNTDEILSLVRWMRNHNAAGKDRVEFWGFDTQLPGEAVDSILAFVRDVDPGQLPSIQKFYGPIKAMQAHQPKRYGAYAELTPQGVPQSRSQARADAISWIAAAQSGLAEVSRVARRTTDTVRASWVRQYAQIVLQSGLQQLNGAGATRDSLMADNVRWIASRYPSRARIVVWAHDSHVMRTPKGMGDFLGRFFTADYTAVATVFYSGSYLAAEPQGFRAYQAVRAPPGTVEDILHRVGHGSSVLLDLVKAQRDPGASWLWEPRGIRQVGLRAAEPGFVDVRLRGAFDGILFVDSSTPAHSLERSGLPPPQSRRPRN